MTSNHNLLLLVALAFAFCGCSSAGQIFRKSFLEMKSITSRAERIFDRFIRTNMKCEELAQCREELTSLRLTSLPQQSRFSLKGNVNQVWVQQLNDQLEGLYTFSTALKGVSLSEYRSSNFHPEPEFIREVFEELDLLSSELTHFINTLRKNVKATYCVDLKEPNPNSQCEICLHPRLPSRPLEIVRNYQFLLQMRDYFDNFTRNFIILSMINPSSCLYDEE